MNDGRVLRFDSNGEPFLGDPPSNVYTIHPPKSDLILFYEVVEPNGHNTWGGGSCIEAIQWLQLAPAGSRLLISSWDSDEEDAHLVGQTIDVTDLIQQARKAGL
jgi:hypothetical protein